MSGAVCSGDLAHDVEELRPYLIRFARTKLSDEHTVEDIVQDTLLAALSGKTPFLGHSALRTWLTSILKFKIVDTYRKNTLESTRRTPRHAREDEKKNFDDGLQSLAEQDRRLGLQDPCEAIERRQLADCLMAAVQKLPAKQRDIFVLVQMHGYSSHDAAKVMGLSRSNVWVILHRARRMLQSHLHGAYH